jgi:hypothetical protein
VAKISAATLHPCTLDRTPALREHANATGSHNASTPGEIALESVPVAKDENNLR